MQKPKRGNTWELEVSDAGEFVREATEFHGRISASGGEFPAARDRYHLYVSYACPWAHRTLIVRALKGLKDVITVNVVHPHLDNRGWHFAEAEASPDNKLPPFPDTNDQLYGSKLLRELYNRSVPSGHYEGRITVPVLWDKQKHTVVNNESSEIIRLLNSEFNAFAKNPELDLYPPALRGKIDELNDWIYPSINNGVYRCGFATSQTAYEKAFDELFTALDRVEELLGKHRYLTGATFTEADVRLFTTLLRFDPVYHNHFRCNLRKLREYPNTWNYMLDIAQIPEVKETIHLDHIKYHYYASHKSINPTGIIPKGPACELDAPHDRARFS